MRSVTNSTPIESLSIAFKLSLYRGHNGKIAVKLQ